MWQGGRHFNPSSFAFRTTVSGFSMGFAHHGQFESEYEFLVKRDYQMF